MLHCLGRLFGIVAEMSCGVRDGFESWLCCFLINVLEQGT